MEQETTIWAEEVDSEAVLGFKLSGEPPGSCLGRYSSELSVH